jgi:hypothetical protein
VFAIEDPDSLLNEWLESQVFFPDPDIAMQVDTAVDIKDEEETEQGAETEMAADSDAAGSAAVGQRSKSLEYIPAVPVC